MPQTSAISADGSEAGFLMAQFSRHFTVEEANDLLPQLRALLEEIRTLRDHLVVEWQNAQPVLRVAPQNGGGREASGYVSQVRRLNLRLRHFSRLGVYLKDIDRGLIDFPHLREGREVFLCWQYNEPAVCNWHELDVGFSGREPV